ncbi:MAG: DUF4097 family beta strand repeat-containing protein [Gemmatimonadaceae bacterium]
MIRAALIGLGTGILLAPLALPCAAQQVTTSDSAFSWRGSIRQGAWLRIHDAKGDVRVMAAEGNEAEVRAVVRNRGERDDEISFELITEGDDVIICAYPKDEGSCDADGVHRESRYSDRRTPSADFTVLLPRGVKIRANSGNGDVMVTNAGAEVDAASGNGEVHVTSAAGRVFAASGNGEVSVDDATGPVRASSGNGRVRVTTATGPVNASSGNGSIDVRMTRLGGEGDMEFHTGNGTITVTVPADFEGELDTNTGNGRVTTDFSLTVSGRIQPNRIRGTIGRGGRKVRMTSGNGNLELRRAGAGGAVNERGSD